MSLEANVFCALPELIRCTLESGVVGRARERGALEVNLYDLHELSPEPHGKIDDCPYGGGPGMVLRVDAVAHALEKVFKTKASNLRGEMPVVLFTPQGKHFDQDTARRLSEESRLTFICGRYEGIDERVRENIASEEVSLGDFVLSGGEVAAAVVMEAVARLLPGVLGNAESLSQESFSGPTLEYPQYTRPASFEGSDVPEVLLSGDHARIEEWRKDKALEVTRRRRPDLLEGR